MIAKLDEIPVTECINPPFKLKTVRGKHYLIFTSTWLECTSELYESITTDQIRSKWRKPSFLRKDDEDKKFSVDIKSNSSDTVYTVKYDRYWSCTCKGYIFRKNCNHIEQAKKLLDNKNQKQDVTKSKRAKPLF
jgi:hypothetical protein